MENYHLSIHIGKNQWLIGFQISLIVIVRQPKYLRFYALVAIDRGLLFQIERGALNDPKEWERVGKHVVV